MELRDALAQFGMAAIVAHKDIKPAAEWQTEPLLSLRYEVPEFGRTSSFVLL